MFYIKAPIVAPVSGKCVPLDTISNSLFGMTQKDGGFAIIPTENTVCAPFDAVVTRVSADHHFVMLTSNEGKYEIIVAADFSVSANGNDFAVKVQAGQKITKGETLFELNIKENTIEGGIVSVPCVVSNLNVMDKIKINYGDAVRGETTVLTTAC